MPIEVDDQLIGFLQTGQVLLKEPDRFRFDSVAKQLVSWGVHVDLSKGHEVYFQTKVPTKNQSRAMLRLLETFGDTFDPRHAGFFHKIGRAAVSWRERIA